MLLNAYILSIMYILNMEALIMVLYINYDNPKIVYNLSHTPLVITGTYFYLQI